jgi:hypothetical protein
MDERRDDLSTADLADQRPRDTERSDDRVEEAELDSHQGRDAKYDDHTPRDDHMPRDDLRMGEDAVADERSPELRREPDEGETAAPAALDGGTAGPDAGPLLASRDAESFRARWTDVQTSFVDAPRQAVEQADGLVAELMQHLAKTFADARGGLEGQWDRGDDVSTDDLRSAFQRYRSFFERLLAT